MLHARPAQSFPKALPAYGFEQIVEGVHLERAKREPVMSSDEDDLRQLVRLAVREDLDRYHDLTTLSLAAADQQGRAAVVVREPGVIAGLRAAPVLIDEMHAAIEWAADNRY